VNDVLTSIEAISEGMPYPPYAARERMARYALNLQRYKGDYNENKYIKIKNLNGGIDNFPIITENYFRLMTNKSQGLLFNEKPFISVKDSPSDTDLLKRLVDKSGFWKAFLAGYRNFSSLGSCVLYLSVKDGLPKVNALNPSCMYKIVDAQNIDTITCYVLVQPIFKVDYKSAEYTKIEKLRVLYHYKGYYIEKLFRYNDNGQIMDCESEKRVDTGLTDFAVFSFENSRPTDEVYGYSDYDAVADVVALYEQTITLVNAVLVKNINPILQVPIGTFTENEMTGKLEAPTDGSVVEVDPGSKDIKYINYDLQITDIMNYLGTLLNELGIQSEMSKTFLTGEFTSNLSGSAIRSLMKAPLDKISRAIDEIDDGIKAIFVQMLHIVGVEREISDIEIVWRDGISETIETANQPTPIIPSPSSPTEVEPVEIETVEGGVLSE
jgi:hypothetical protein